MTQTFVYEDTEVKLTGRIATRKLIIPPGKTRTLTLVEITPVKDFDWLKWVEQDKLYEIKQKDE